MVTQSGAGEVQDLDYGYDDRLNLTHRTDALQPQNTTERFRHDALHRLTCAYFSEVESASAPCALRYDYAPNGNLTFKSDVGTLLYDDPVHPHAVTSAGTDSFSYDALGNQIARPGGTTVRYTPFDLPERITQGTSTITFAYDGDQQRIRKTTPDKETLYFDDLYERVTGAASGTVEHRYHIHSPERVVAIVTRGGSDDGTRYVHVDHLGSVDALTDEDGDVIERRSYDPFGQRRNPVWGERAPASFSSETTQGFTGHESDDELGLVNMKGRILDPRIGRFLTTDPIVSIPSFGQSWNPYSYVLNNPLAYVDPSGFQQALPEDGARSPLPAGAEFSLEVLDLSPIGLELIVVPSSEHEAGAGSDPNTTAAKTGGAMPPSDVSVVGTSSGFVPEPALSSAEATSPASLVGDTLLGAAEGTGELAVGLAQSLVLNTMTLGGYGTYALGRAMWDGYQEGGFLGAVNAVNPLYEIGRNEADTALAIDRGDYRAAGAAGVKATLLGAATVFGAGRGLRALAEESAAAVGAATATRKAYSVAFETTIPKAGIGRYPAHFAAANENLLREMTDPLLAPMLRQTLGQQFESTILSPTGRVLGRSPTGWTWHHVPGRPGVLQLVPIEQHASGSSWQHLLHPNEQGGMSEWGHLY
ncbi:RHS repeat-associated core domain-containing protein [Sorangium sp. So ce1014]|uniref:RHS repeat-associated core domain-containing protein n=1 Tax=Sorangium sp. So ce1014 TaxID=3133326 RepID=UPI003F5F7994